MCFSRYPLVSRHFWRLCQHFIHSNLHIYARSHNQNQFLVTCLFTSLHAFVVKCRRVFTFAAASPPKRTSPPALQSPVGDQTPPPPAESKQSQQPHHQTIPNHLPSSSSSHPNTNHNNHLAHHADQVNTSLAPHLPKSKSATKLTNPPRVRTLTGKEIELDIEPDYKVRPHEAEARNKAHDVCFRMTDCGVNTTGPAHKGARRGEGGHPASTAAPDLRRQADVSMNLPLCLGAIGRTILDSLISRESMRCDGAGPQAAARHPRPAEPSWRRAVRELARSKPESRREGHARKHESRSHSYPAETAFKTTPLTHLSSRADDKTAEEYALEGGATLHLVLALRGGSSS